MSSIHDPTLPSVNDAISALMAHPKEESIGALKAAGLLPAPSPETADKIWKQVVSALIIILLLSFVSLAVFLYFGIADSDKILTIFTSVLGFLGGFLVPSPIEKK